MAVHSHIDQPADWSQLTRCVIIRGWAFADDGRVLNGVRLVTRDRSLHGVVGLPRPDVRAALPVAPTDDTGFEIRGTLPAGAQQLRIELLFSDDSIALALDRHVRISHALFPLWLGGGHWTELMFFQMPSHMAYPPRPVALEKFPRVGAATRPRLAIVTPSFRHAAYLEQTMRSILEQNTAADYVVQDGGSQDGTVQILQRLAREFPANGDTTRPRLVAWHSASDHGQADAIARGFAQTQGGPEDVMAYLNSDDVYQPGALTFVAEYFARHPEVDAIYGHRIVIDEQSREIARWFLPGHDDEVLRLNDFVPQETLFWRRRLWDRVGGIDSSFHFAIDWDLLLRFQAAGAKIVRVPYFLACFRAHAAQKTSAAMHSTGQSEITRLRERTHGRSFPAHEIEGHPLLMRYLRRSAFLEFAWRRLGLRLD